MAATTQQIIGTGAKGIMGLSDNTVAGIVIDDISFENTTQEHEYLDINGDVTTCAYDKHEINITINGRKLAGTSLSDNVAAVLALTTIANYLPTGYDAGGTNVITAITESQAISDYQTISITAKHYPKMTGV